MAHQVVLIPPRRSTVAPFLQPSLSASSAVRPRLISMTFSSPSPGTRLASTRTTQLASMPSTIICSRSASCLRLHAYRRTHPSEAAIREAHRSPQPGSRAAPAQAVEPAIPTPAAPTPQQRPAVPERQLPATPAVDPSHPSHLCRCCGGCGTLDHQNFLMVVSFSNFTDVLNSFSSAVNLFSSDVNLSFMLKVVYAVKANENILTTKDPALMAYEVIGDPKISSCMRTFPFRRTRHSS